MRQIPQVLLLVAPKDLARVVDEVRYIEELLLLFLGILMPLDYCTGYYADIMLSGQCAVSVQVDFPFTTKFTEVWIFRDPVGEVILRENCQLRALCCGLLDECHGLGVVGFEL